MGSQKAVSILANEPLSPRQTSRLGLNSPTARNLKLTYVYVKSLDTHTQVAKPSVKNLIQELSDLDLPEDILLWAFPATRWRSILAFYYLRHIKKMRTQGLIYLKPIPLSGAQVSNVKKPAKVGYIEAIINKVLIKSD